jgi:predicted protein tyrosine phosphatase
MLPVIVPFKTTICGIDELEGHCALGVTHVLSILDPAAPEPPAFGAFGEHERVELRFDDIIEETPDKVMPQQSHVRQILDLGQDLIREARDGAHLLVHCHAGISRSTAAMSLILAQACPELPGSAIIAEILRIRAKAWPNLLLIEFGDALLGRGGDLVAAVPHAYRAQIERRPELEQYFIAAGRGREVERARTL